MNKIKGYLDEQKKKYGKVYVDVTYAINEISGFLNEDVLKNKKFVSRLPVLKKYMELIETANYEADKKGILDVFRSDEKYKDMLEDYKHDNREQLKQLVNCSECACLKCVAECNFKACLGCRPNSKIVSCDKNKINVTSHSNYIIHLRNDKTGETATYKVLATLQDVEVDSEYIVIQNVVNRDEKFILYYYPGISEDMYGEITEGEEFDYIVSVFDSADFN